MIILNVTKNQRFPLSLEDTFFEKLQEVGVNLNVISDKIYNDLYPTESRPGTLYGLYKMHKSTADGVRPFTLFCPLELLLILLPYFLDHH